MADSNTTTMSPGDTDTNTTTRFNTEALTWDTRPNVIRATTLGHAAYLSQLPPPTTLSTYDALEIGCGTGLLSLLLAPSLRSLTAVDAAPGMIDMLRHKLSASPPPATNILPMCALLTDENDARIGVDPVTGETQTGRRFDLVISHLVLHHIADLEGLFAMVFRVLKSGGRVAVTDYEDFGPEARRFHPEGKMGEVERHGIGRGGMRALLEGAGFEEVRVETAFEMEKMVETEPGNRVMEHKMTFPFLICLGRKPGGE